MASLRDRWRRSYIYDYFASMAPEDRAVALIALLLASAIATVFSVYVQSREASAPVPTARPIAMDFAVTR
jgi:hypothetical protein